MADVELNAVGIPPGQVDLWSVTAENFSPPDARARFSSFLSNAERQHYGRLLYERDRHLYLLSHVLVRSVLSRYLDVSPEEWRFDTGPRGKPFVVGPIVAALQFNLTHAAGTALCAVTAGDPVGVDLESVSAGPAVRKIAPRYFSESERRALNQVPEKHADLLAVELWTLKEAYAKALGQGLHMHWPDFTIELPQVGLPMVQCPKAVADAPSWQLGVLELWRTSIAAVVIGRCARDPFSMVFRELQAPDLAPAKCELVPSYRERRWQVRSPTLLS